MNSRLVAILCVASVVSVAAESRGQGQDITVTLLGTGNSPSSPDRFAISTLVQAGDQTLIFDAGRGVLQRLVQAGVTAAQVDAVFITHLHSDHFLGLPELWLGGWFTSSRSRPWPFFGPLGTATMTSHLEQAFTIDIQSRVDENPGFLNASGAKIHTVDIKAGVVFDTKGVRVTAFEVDHGAIAPAFGFRIDYAGRSVVLSGDTRPSEALVKAAAGADLIVHEVSETSDELLKTNPRLQKPLTFHTQAADAGRIFKRIAPKMAVYSHINTRGLSRDELVRRTRSTYEGPLLVGEDLMRIIVGTQVTVLRPGS